MHGARAISRLNHFNLNDEMLHPNDLMRLMREIALIAGKLRIQFKRHLASSDVNFPFIGPLLFAVLIIGYFDRVEAKHALLARLDRKLAEQRVAKAAALTAEVDALAQLRQQHSTLTAAAECAKEAFERAKVTAYDDWSAKWRAEQQRDSQQWQHLNPVPSNLPNNELQCLPEYADNEAAQAALQPFAQDFDSAKAVSGQDSAETATTGRTQLGQSWQSKRQLFVNLFHKVRGLLNEVEQAEQPPAPVMHSLPDTGSGLQLKQAQSLVFFLHPEHTGCMPQLAQSIFEVAQAMHAPSSIGHCRQQDSEPLWHTFYCQRHQRCPYVPAPHLCSASDEADCHELVLLKVASPLPATGQSVPMNVRHFKHCAGHGVVYPALGRQLCWQGGAAPRLGDTAPRCTDPFPDATAAVQREALSHFTEPGELHAARMCPTRGPSRLAAISQGSQLPELADMAEDEHEVRGNAVLTAATSMHKGSSREQWLRVAGVRLYPLSQMSQLCAAILDGSLDTTLHHPEVRILSLQLASWLRSAA